MARTTLPVSLYCSAGLGATGRVVRTGRIGWRGRNVAVWRGFGKAGLWSGLWR